MKAKFKVGDRVIIRPERRRKRHVNSKCVGTVIDTSNLYSYDNKHLCYEVKIDDLDKIEVFYSYELNLVDKAAPERTMVANIIETPDGTILWSRFTHDYVQYHDSVSDEDYMLDGGREYRRTFVNTVPAKDLSVYSDDPWDLQRQYRLRGTFDKAGKRVWVPIAKLSNLHIKNLVANTGLRMDTPYWTELCYREDHHIEIPDHDYKNEGIQSLTKTGKQ